MDDDDVKAMVDYREVGRKVDEMEMAHGRDGARRYAAKLASQAAGDERSDEAFWKAVELGLTRR